MRQGDGTNNIGGDAGGSDEIIMYIILRLNAAIRGQ